MFSKIKISTGFILLLATIVLRLSAQGQPAAASAVDQAVRAKIERYLRERFSIPDAATITVGALQPSIFPAFYTTEVTVANGKATSSQEFYVTKDGGYLVAGSIYGLNGSPERQVESMINTRNQPATGPENAPVTIVEYADLECPHCAQMQDFLVKQVLPKYGAKVRIVFKEYPLYTIHPWAVQAAVANECAFKINPADFVSYRSLIFQNQSSIQTATVRKQLLDLGAQAGLDRQKLAACYDAKEAMPQVRADYLEGQKLGVEETPTFFVNGKMVAGAATPADFFKLIDAALAQAGANAQNASASLPQRR